MHSSLDDLRLPLLPQTAILNQTPEYVKQLQAWNAQTLQVIQSLNGRLQDPSVLSPNDIAAAYAITIPLSTDVAWSEENLRNTSISLLTRLPHPTLDIVISVLNYHIKPCFLKNPHVQINPESGRKLHRPAGGSAAIAELYEDQEWKNSPWIGSLIQWCLKYIGPGDYERVWPLVIPPTMTLLDDYELYNKLAGVKVVSEMLNKAPVTLLKRTGVDGLLKSSLKSALLHLHSPFTADLIRLTIPAFVKLAKLTTADGSKARFDELSNLIGDSILGGIWLYAYNEYDTLEASIKALPSILEELGIGSIRFLKPLVSQLVHNITEVAMVQASYSMQVASVELLQTLMTICRPRIFHWSGLMTFGFARCWAALQETTYIYDKSHLQEALKQACGLLMNICPSVAQNEYNKLLSCDNAMFQDLLPTTVLVT